MIRTGVGWWHRLPIGVAACTIVALGHTALATSEPILVWNASPSVARGLYVIWQASIRKGDLVLSHLPVAVEAFAAEAHVLSPDTPVLKHVMAVGGDVVCRMGSTIHINGRQIAVALPHDTNGTVLPIWSGCHLLQHDDVFLMNFHGLSFDGRYFGPTKRHLIVGRAFSFRWEKFWAAAGVFARIRPNAPSPGSIAWPHFVDLDIVD